MVLNYVCSLCLLIGAAWGAIQVEENHPRFDQTPYVLLISIDGHRHDYNELYDPPTLSRFAREGVRAESLIPGFPSITFPSHLSIATGLYPGGHGIVNNIFYAPDLGRNYTYRDPNTVKDAAFYSGIPIWSLASQNQMVSAVYFWPGSEAPIAGHFPSHYMAYNSNTPHTDRVEKVIEWFKLPLRKRPHFVSLYFSDVDSAGHRYGPLSFGVRQAVFKVDRSLKDLFRQLAQLNLDLNIIITSDHGMIEVRREIVIDEDVEVKELLGSFHIPSSGSSMFLHYKGQADGKRKAVDRLFELLSRSASQYRVYRRRELPPEFHGRDNPRFGDLILLAEPPYLIRSSGRPALQVKGMHGYDFKHPDMHGIFFAQGPGFRKGLVTDSLESVHIYPLMAHLLGLTPGGTIDGNLQEIKEVLAISD